MYLLLVNVSKDISLAVNTRKVERGHHRGMFAKELIRIGSNSYEKVKTFKYLSSFKIVTAKPT